MNLNPITYSIIWSLWAFLLSPLVSIIVLGICGYFVAIARFFTR